MRKAIVIAALVLTAVSWGVFVVRAANDPAAAHRRELTQALAAVGEQRPAREHFVVRPELDYGRLQSSIKSRPALWRELVPPPPPPAPPPPPPPPPPNLGEMLRGVSVQRGQIGSGDAVQVPINVPGAGGRAFYGVGDVINGLTIKAIDNRQVVFSLMHDGREYTTALRRP